MNRHFSKDDHEARAEYSERFGDPQQQGIHETYMRPQPCAAHEADPYQPLFDYLHDEMGVLALQTDMQEIIQICLAINAEASGRRDKASSVEGVVGKLVEMGNLRDGNGDEVVGILIECSKADLQACDLRMYGDVLISNAEASGRRDKAAFAGPDVCDMDLPTALAVADQYSKPSAGIGCLHSDAYKRLALEIRRIHNIVLNDTSQNMPTQNNTERKTE